MTRHEGCWSLGLGAARRASRSVTFLAVMAMATVGLVAIPDAQAAGCAQAPTALEAWWPGNGNTNERVHDRAGTLIDGAATAAAQVGQGFTFDGVDDAVSVPDDPVAVGNG